MRRDRAVKFLDDIRRDRMVARVRRLRPSEVASMRAILVLRASRIGRERPRDDFVARLHARLRERLNNEISEILPYGWWV